MSLHLLPRSAGILALIGALSWPLTGSLASPDEQPSNAPISTREIIRPGWLGLGLNYRENKESASASPTGWFFVRHVHANGPGAKAGFRAHDLITEIDGRPFQFADGMQVLDYFAGLEAGQEIEMTVRRSSAKKTLRIIPVRMPGAVYEKWKILYQEVKRRHKANLGHL